MAYVYCHFKMGSFTKIFYIGVGGLHKFDNYKRAYETRTRSKEWKERASGVCWDWDILEDNLTKEKALEREKHWIKSIGRLNNHTGMLSNLTNGGEGSAGRVVPKEQRDYLRNRYKGQKRPKEVVDRYVQTRKDRGNYKKSQKTKDKISNSLMGNKNPFFGKKQPKWVIDKHSKIVLNTETGIFYDSIKEAALTTNFKYDHFKSMLNGNAINTTMFKHA